MTAAMQVERLVRGTRVQFNGFADYMKAADQEPLLGEIGTIEGEGDAAGITFRVRLDRGETVQAEPDEFEVVS